MCIKLRSTRLLKGINIREHNARLSMYADDSTIFLANEEQELRNAILILKRFHRVSGLRIHMGKTQCVRIGCNTQRESLCPELGLCWEQKFKLLGVNFDADTLCYSMNIEAKIKDMVSVMEDW